MVRFIFNRFLQLILILFLASILIFFMVRISGIDPVAAIVGGGQTSKEVIDNIRAKFHLNESVESQYLIWIGNAIRGDFGVSYKFQQAVTSMILDRLPVTLGLSLATSIITIAIAIPAGVISAVKMNTRLDLFISILVLVLFSSPVFLTSIIMILVISNVAPDFSFTGSFNGFDEYLRRLLFPVMALSFYSIALMLRVTRSSLIEQIQSHYVLTATAKGLPARLVIFKHALKNAIIPVITVGGIQIGALVVGTVLVESVFSLPGVGSLLIESIKSGDYPIVQAITLLLVVVFLVVSLVVDVSCALIDPRIKLQ
jgi:peptide/nickel transport system permease protein